MNPLDHPIAFSTPRRLARISAWREHIPFGMLLVDVLRPDVVVELGTHTGNSYCAFCQAVDELRLTTKCYAIDTWEGDPHTGVYGPEVLADLRGHHDPRYAGFSRLIQGTFDQALQHFADGSIDLLHIDGCHTYGAVRNDFEAWLPKLSDRAVVLLHDINTRERDFGVWRLWEEVKLQYPCFELVHAHGLGLLAVGKSVPQSLQALLNSPPEQQRAVRDLFFALGHRLRLMQQIDDIQDVASHRKQALAEAQRQLASQRKVERRPASGTLKKAQAEKRHKGPNQPRPDSAITSETLGGGRSSLIAAATLLDVPTNGPHALVQGDDASETSYSQAIEMLEHAAGAIVRAAKRLEPQELRRAVGTLLGCRGNVVVIGTGKSGIAARKIAGTLTSTGTAAIYLHAGDAMHGDLGIVTDEDCAIAVSNSGENDEVVALLTHLRQRRVPVIAIVGDVESTIAGQADVVLDASVDTEACPLNLAPTTSTTVAIVIGDALAAILMRTKGFTAEDFALNHPAGQLGKRLTLRVRDLMHGGARNATVGPDATWIEVIEEITQKGLGAANVVDDSGSLVGLVTDGDVRRSIQRFGFADLGRVHATDFMTKGPVVVQPEVLAYDALRLMEERESQIPVLPVVDSERCCIGLLRIHDIVQAGLR